MEENGDYDNRSSDEVDRLSDLPESLICEVLLKLPTKDVVKTSLLSRRWQNLWKLVLGLDLNNHDFLNNDAFVAFVHSFLVNSESCIRNFKLKFDWDEDDEPDLDHFVTWINTVVKRKIEHLHLLFEYWEWDDPEVEIPPTVYTCKSLVSVKLSNVRLPNPEFVSLACVKDIKLEWVKFVNDLAFEMLVSGCPVLESLFIARSYRDNVRVLRVCSQSLLSITVLGDDVIEDDQVVVIDAPKLEYLKFRDNETSSFVINNAGSLAKVDIDAVFNFTELDPDDKLKRNMIRKFLIGISSVKVMNIYSYTLEVIYNYSRYERLPLFRNLSSLHANFFHYRWEMLPIFLESCPNLKHLSLGFSQSPWEQPISILPGPYSHLPKLEFVEIVKPMIDDEAEMNLVSYFLENSLILKTLTLFVNPYQKSKTSDILKSLTLLVRYLSIDDIREKIIAIPKLSTSCQVVVRRFKEC